MRFKFVKFKRKARFSGPLATLLVHCLTYGQANVNKAIPRACVIARQIGAAGNVTGVPCNPVVDDAFISRPPVLGVRGCPITSNNEREIPCIST
jgi:hypothetical protein